MKCKLVLGDWSGDGHRLCTEIIFDCNYPIKDIQDAYKSSCKKFFVQFNSGEDYTGLGSQHNDSHMIWTQDGEISESIYKILEREGCFKNVNIKKYADGYCGDTYEDCAVIIMNFIALSMPKDFIYTLVEDSFPYINGHWNDNLNATFGYGLFDY